MCRPPCSTIFPYTTLFRSRPCRLLEAVLIAFLLCLELATTTATAGQALIVIGGTGSDAALAGATGTLATALVFLDTVPTALLFLLARSSSGSRGQIGRAHV